MKRFVIYSLHLMDINQTFLFCEWLVNLRDHKAVAKIKARLILMEAGSFGDVKPCDEGVSESRIHYGPGYRIYFIQRGAVMIVVLGGGIKRTQSKDIRKAKEIARLLEDQA